MMRFSLDMVRIQAVCSSCTSKIQTKDLSSGTLPSQLIHVGCSRQMICTWCLGAFLPRSTVSIHTVYQSFLLIWGYSKRHAVFFLHLVYPCVGCFCPWGPDGSDLPFVSGVVCRSPWSHCLCSFHTIPRATSAECNGYCHVGGPFGMTSWRRGETGETNN